MSGWLGGWFQDVFCFDRPANSYSPLPVRVLVVLGRAVPAVRERVPVLADGKVGRRGLLRV